ncbi:hypothetical protein TWF696_001678 [Orbilia brochopaga]|uniref:F-box domain-containing protein n=1 Tax=Orbilia brochopaga TaxID=3140254 RepID=A0AAV9U604_9PEZI
MDAPPVFDATASSPYTISQNPQSNVAAAVSGDLGNLHLDSNPIPPPNTQNFFSVTSSSIPASTFPNASQDGILPTPEASSPSRVQLPRCNLLSLSNDNLLRIMSNLPVDDIRSFTQSCRHIYNIFHIAVDYPLTEHRAFLDIHFPTNALYTGILTNTLSEQCMASWFPQFHNGCTWNILAQEKGSRLSNSQADQMVLYLTRLQKIEGSVNGLLQCALSIPTDLWTMDQESRLAYEGLMYRAAIAWAQSHIFGIKFNSSNPAEVAGFETPTIGLPPLPLGFNEEYVEYAERLLCDSVARLIWPIHTVPEYWQCDGRTQWDFHVTSIAKGAFISTAHPQLLMELIWLRKPSMAGGDDINPDAEMEQQKYDATVADMLYWIRQVMKGCPSAEIWGRDPDDRQLQHVWTALKDHQACLGVPLEADGFDGIIEDYIQNQNFADQDVLDQDVFNQVIIVQNNANQRTVNGDIAYQNHVGRTVMDQDVRGQDNFDLSFLDEDPAQWNNRDGLL